MALRTRSSLTLGGVSASASTGRSIGLRAPAAQGRYTAQVVFANSTSAKITMQGSIDGQNWKTIGTAATVVKTSAPFLTVSTAVAYSSIRAILTSRSTKAPGPPSISVFMNAV